MATNRSIQFRRNVSTIYTNSSQAKTAITNNQALYNDGEQIFGRYWSTDKNGQPIIATLVGLVCVNGGSKYITFSDPSDNTALDKVVTAVGLSGNTINENIGYSAHTAPSFISGQTPTSIQTEIIAIESAITPTSGTEAKVSGTTAGEKIVNNIISVTKDGIEAYVDLNYDKTKNKLVFLNTNGSKDVEMSGITSFSSATYSAESEEIIIYYQKYGELTASTLNIPVSGIMEEYDFKYATSGGTDYNTGFTATDHNVSLKYERLKNGKTKVYGDIDIFDCGTY